MPLSAPPSLDHLVQLTREELYERVWGQPLRSVAAALGFSDVALAKRCRKFKIPVPGRGYWRKIETGKHVRRIPLPAVAPTSQLSQYHVVFDTPPVPPPPPIPTVVDEQIAFERAPENQVVVSDQLRSPHPLVRKTDEILSRAKPWPGEYVIMWREQYLDVRVTKPNVPRALRVMDALVKACEKRGWIVSLGTGDDQKSYLTILGQRVPFGIREKLRQRSEEEKRIERERHYPAGTVLSHSTHYGSPSGRLSLVIRNSWGHSVHRSWNETESDPIERQLNAFLVGLVAVAAENRERNLRFQEENRLRREAAQRRALELQREAAEAARKTEFERQAADWNKAQQMREFIAAVRNAAQPPDAKILAGMSRDEWIAWAEQCAQSLDPLHADHSHEDSTEDST